jgi:hypothetical protein
MIGPIKRFLLRNLVSPVGIAAMSFGIFLVAWLFPPNLYAEIMQEPNYMFLDWRNLVFCSTCVAAFLLGVKASRVSLTSLVTFLFGVVLTGDSLSSNTDRRSLSARVQVRCLPLVIPVAISVLLGCTTLVVIGIKTDNIALLLAEQGQAIKEAIAARDNVDLSFWGKLIPLAPVHMAIIWWFAFRLREAEIPRTARRWMVILLCFAILVAIGNAVVHAERVSLMPILVGLFPLYVFTSPKLRAGDIWTVLKPIGFGLGGIVGVFYLLSFLRGNVVTVDPRELLLGYTISSYGRLALLLKGSLRFDYPGNIQDLCWFFSYNKYFNAVIPYASFFNIPDPIVSWASDFPAMGDAGLRVAYMYPTVFGYVFRDIGFWSPVYFACQGVLVGWAWKSFRNGRVYGLMLYPWCVFSILFWFGWNLFLTDTYFYISGGAVIMAFYERRFLKWGPIAFDDEASLRRPGAPSPVSGSVHG